MLQATQLLDALARDARYALRTLRKSPVFAATAVLTLAVGIGANAAIFSMVDALLLRSLPYPEPERLALLSTDYRTSDGQEFHILSQTGTTWEAVRDHAKSLDAAPFTDWVTGVNLFADGRASNVDQQRVGAGYFEVLGVRPALGRSFTSQEDVPGGPALAVLSDGLWRRAFGADPGILGRSILLRGEPHTVVGVMPEGFRSTAPAEVWTPMHASTTGEGEGQNYAVLARLRPGVSWQEAEAEVAAIAGAAWEASGRSAGGRATARFGIEPLRSGLVQDQRATLLVLWAAVGVVLLIVCANLASLMLARSAGRSREIAARMALGGSRGAVARQVLVEGLVLSLAGGALGVLLGTLGLDVLSGLAREALGVWQPVALDARVIAATALLALATSVAFALGPALLVARLDPRAALAEGTRSVAGASSHWPRRVLVVAEVALGVVLVVFAGLLVRTFLELRGLDAGFDPAGVVAGSVSLEDARYRDRASIERLFDESLERIRALPGVEGAAVSLGLPYERLLNLGFEAVRADGTHTEPAAVSASYVTPGFFETLRIPLLRGRLLSGEDGPDGAPVAVVNQAFAERYLAGGSPLASRVKVGGEERAIVGVVASVLQNPEGLGGSDPLTKLPVVYVPSAQVADAAFVLVHTWFQPSWVVRSALPVEETAAAMRGALREVDPRLPFASFRRLDEVAAEALAYQRFLMTLVASLAAVAALLAALGIHGLVAHTVLERTRELGIRLALGSTRAQALTAVAVPGVVLAAAGVLLGTGLALASSRVLTHFIWGVSATDPVVFSVGAGALVLLAAAASLVPGLRVLELDPARALREE